MMKLIFVIFITLTSCFDLDGVKSRYPLQNVGGSLEISVLTFNILSTLDLGALAQGYPTWWSRRSKVFAVIEDNDADFVSLQESSPTQFEEFRDRFGGKYFVIHKMAFTPDAILLIKKDRFDILEKGFWSLESPLAPKIRRIAVWAKVQDKISSRQMMVIATHLDAKASKSHELSHIHNELTNERLSGAPLIFAGDMNITSDVSFYPLLLSDFWKDSYLGDLKDEVKTFPLKHPTRRIDHILYSGKDITSIHWERIDNQGYAFSDHFPVLARFQIEKAE